ncbi:MAG TPA: DUF1559 domain-containing protein [Capsulimonadaceae bacterium]|jgi:prepilin-type N-terminal cleavage/methylation domain-containing protein/prepilin-type processing-associated H-X9-DG protein
MKRAFTLIELLVVIAIIAILAAILFPVFATAREKARQTSCASNEKQLALGLLQYVSDFDEMMPCGRVSTAPEYHGVAWAGQTYSYVKSTQAFACPDDVTVVPAGDVNHVVVSYAINSNVCGKSGGPYGSTPAISKLTMPAKTVMLSEVSKCSTVITTNPEAPNSKYSVATNGGWFANDKTNFDIANTGSALATGWLGRTNTAARYYGFQNSSGSQLGPQFGRHSDGANYACMDGHVKWLKGDQVSSGDSASSSTAAQGSPGTPGGGNWPGNAAGTEDKSANPAFTVTFSAI